MNILYIFRRDLRIEDNTGLNSIINKNNNIYPIFIFTPEQIDNNTYKSDNCVQFMIESLIDLHNNINITFCYGDMIKVISDIVKKNNIDMICTNTDYTPYSIKREKLIQKLANKLNISFKYYHDILLYDMIPIKTKGGDNYQKFTPFYRTVIKNHVRNPFTHKLLNAKHTKTKYMIDIKKMQSFYEHNEMLHVNGSRINGLKILHNLKNFKSYDKTRNIMHVETTNLSAYLKFGCISIRECYYAMHNNHDLLRQLIWREFYYYLGYNFIERFGNSLKEKYDNIKWDNNIILFNKWCKGMTGFPIVDACMMQLNTTGYMHNRGRLIVASFLIKNLHVDWRKGEKYFATKLVDYDVMVNQGNWQWVAGCGADSMPYFRIFNPSLQSMKFDKDAIYIKKWLPQLKTIEAKHLHDWEKYNSMYNMNEIKYVKPIIDFKNSKKRTLILYKMIF